MIYVITPTGDRPEAFKLCVDYVNRQTKKPDMWLIVDDGTTDAVDKVEADITVPHTVIKLPPIKEHSLCRNLREALSAVPDSASVCVMEDDDWYPKNYIEEMDRLLSSNPFVLLNTFNAYNVKTRQYRVISNTDDGMRSAMHGDGFSGEAVKYLKDILGKTDSWTIDTMFCTTWKGGKTFNEKAVPVHITGFGTGREGTTPSHRIIKNSAGWSADANGEMLSKWIGADVKNYLSDTAKVYIISNVEYPESKKLNVNPEDLLVFLNKAWSIGYYKDHKNKVVYHRSPDDSYGEERLDVKNRYVFDAGKLSIPKGPLDNLRAEYDWDYPIEAGSVKSATTGYMVVKYMQYAYPTREIILVNFGFDVAKSTYRCPWHNWIYENRMLSRYKHIYTADTAAENNPEKAKAQRIEFSSVSERALTAIFVEAGCDQMTRHDYGEIYDRQFAKLRGRNTKVISIGTSSVANIKAIRKALPQAEVYGIGKGMSDKVEGATVIKGDGYNAEAWKDLPLDFDLIIDDGTHKRDDILRGLPIFLYHLAKDGSLLIEDVPTDDDVIAITDKLPGAECYRPTPVSNYNDDRVIVYSRSGIRGKLREKSEYEVKLTSVFVNAGSDRTTRHDYGEVYALQFEPLQGKKAKMAEIGGFRGSGLRAARELLPDATLYGVAAAGVSKEDNVISVSGDGYDENTWKTVPQDLDLIVDDGSHKRADIIRGIPTFVNHLKDGGRLLIEDIPSEDDVSAILKLLPGAVCYRTTPVSEYNDDRIIVYTHKK